MPLTWVKWLSADRFALVFHVMLCGEVQKTGCLVCTLHRRGRGNFIFCCFYVNMCFCEGCFVKQVLCFSAVSVKTASEIPSLFHALKGIKKKT
jgi:hypothetical protein